MTEYDLYIYVILPFEPQRHKGLPNQLFSASKKIQSSPDELDIVIDSIDNKTFRELEKFVLDRVPEASREPLSTPKSSSSRKSSSKRSSKDMAAAAVTTSSGGSLAKKGKTSTE